MPSIDWSQDHLVVVMDALRPFGEILDALQGNGRTWVVFFHSDAGKQRSQFYVFSPEELRRVFVRSPARATRTALDALVLQEWAESRRVPIGATSAEHPSRRDPRYPSQGRVVAISDDGSIEVGELVDATRGAPPKAERHTAGVPDSLGEFRGVLEVNRDTAQVAGEPRPERVDVLLSAEGPAEIGIGQEAIVDVRVELAARATPLAHVIPAAIDQDGSIIVILTAEPGSLEVVSSRLIRLAPPGDVNPSVGTSFVIRGRAAGAASLAVMFRQGASDLGTIVLKMRVVDANQREGTISGRVAAVPRDRGDDEVLVLLVDEEAEDGSFRYRYRVYSRALELNFTEFLSRPVQPVGTGERSAPLAYVREIHRALVERVLANRDDIATFARELKGIGVDMCRQLFTPDFARLLWARRGDIVIVQLTSWEPYMPWELLRLQHPDTLEVDDRFLGEYGLIRTLSGNTPPRVLGGADWRYLVGTYPEKSHPEVADERPYLTEILPKAGVNVHPIAAAVGDFLDALACSRFDVLHVTCHGRTDMEDGSRTELIISDRRTSGGISPVTVSARTIAGEARLQARRTMVFLNACETGRLPPGLTSWGGWPRTFFDVGAGAFVGTSWSVRDRPAAVFAETFYSTLLNGKSLAEAAVAARAAAKVLGDASWLAFVVYGNPLARMDCGRKTATS